MRKEVKGNSAWRIYGRVSRTRDPGIKVYDAFYIRHLRKLSCFSYTRFTERCKYSRILPRSIGIPSIRPTCYINLYRNSLCSIYSSSSLCQPRISQFRLREILHRRREIRILFFSNILFVPDSTREPTSSKRLPSLTRIERNPA